MSEAKTEVLPEVRKAASGVVKKDSTATVPTKKGYTYTYTYTSLAAVIEHVNIVMGLEVNQNIVPDEKTPGRLNVVTRYRRIMADTARTDEGWSEWLAPVPIIPQEARNPAQAFGSALSYARRYSIQCALGLAADDNDASDEREREPRPITEQMVQRINQLLQDKNVQNQQQAEHMYLAALAGQEIKSSRDLTDIQAEQVIATLEKWRNQ